EALDGKGNIGASQVEHFSWKTLLDAFSCTECGRCVPQCPAAATDWSSILDSSRRRFWNCSNVKL
ncbi:MAG: 4Fe-4S dicluster domain-containing protein, partial [Cellulomonadaceae bacterium]|nr:4Fe-4S dicluster domain-containing protein [Cellulomonadaceae bacterium]